MYEKRTLLLETLSERKGGKTFLTLLASSQMSKKMKTYWEEWKTFITMLAVTMSFALVNILLKKVLDEGMNHLVLVTYRLSISAIFLAPIAYFWERSGRPRLTFRVLCYLFFSAIVGASVTQYLFLLGIQYTSATFACAFVNIVPVLTFIMALPFRLETVNIKSTGGKAKVAGAVVCIVGTTLLIFYKGKPLLNFPHLQSTAATMESAFLLKLTTRTQKWTMGSIALILGTLFWSSWFLLQTRIGKMYPCKYSSTAIMSFFGAIQSAILSFSTAQKLSVWVLRGPMEIITVLFAGMVGSGLCFVAMTWCVKKRGPVFTASFSPLVQIMAATIDIPILHEELDLGSLIGSIIVMIGLYSLLWGKNKDGHSLVEKPIQEARDSKETNPNTVDAINTL